MTIFNHGNLTLSNRLIAMSQTQVIETLSSLGDDLPGEINSVGHQHYRKYHHDNIYYDIHGDALFHYCIHNITAFHCFFTRVKVSQGGNLRTDLTATFLTAHSTVFLFIHFYLAGCQYQLAALLLKLLTVFKIGFSSMQSSGFMKLIDKTFIFLNLRIIISVQCSYCLRHHWRVVFPSRTRPGGRWSSRSRGR